MLKSILSCILIFSLIACGGKKDLAAGKKEIELPEKQRVAFGRKYIEASKEKILGNYDKAEDLYKKAISINPRSAAAHYELGQVYGLQKKTELAFKEFQQANKLEPQNYWYKISYATFLQSEGRIQESIEVFKELVEENPSQVELKYELSKLLFNEGKYKESISYLDQIEQEMGLSQEISYLKQRIYLSENDVDAASNEIRRLINSFPEDLRHYKVLADIYHNNGKKKKALEVYQEMARIDSSNYIVQFSLAQYYRSEKDRPNYVKAIQKAFAHPEMNIDEKVKYFLNFYQMDSKNKSMIAEGMLLCEKIVEAHPDNAKAHALYADFLYFNNERQKAIASYKKTIAIDSSRFPVWNQMLIIMSEVNDQKGLLNYSKRATALFPNQPTLFLIYGLALSRNKEYHESIKALNYGKDLVIDNQSLKSQIYSSIGDAYHELEDHQASDANYKKALELDPNNIYVLNNYSYYLSLRKENLEEAKKMSLKSNELAPNQSSFQDTYAWILYQLGEFDLANEWIDKALSNDASSGVLLDHKGDILFKMGKKEEAVKFWQRAKISGLDSETLDKKIEEKKLYE